MDAMRYALEVAPRSGVRGLKLRIKGVASRQEHDVAPRSGVRGLKFYDNNKNRDNAKSHPAQGCVDETGKTLASVAEQVALK